jgi:site-specific DNA-methyltransferase (adenine-specific)
MVGKATPVKGNNNWSTPQWFFDYFNKLYGFQVDLAANEDNTKCEEWFDETQNSLIQDWHNIEGWCWCNPPYGHQLHNWLEKAYNEMKLGAKICMLTIASTGAAYWEKFIINKVKIVNFIIGRVPFVLPDGTIKEGAMYDSAVIIFDKDFGRTEYKPLYLKDIKK